jgi:hypothetical protein
VREATHVLLREWRLTIQLGGTSAAQLLLKYRWTPVTPEPVKAGGNKDQLYYLVYNLPIDKCDRQSNLSGWWYRSNCVSLVQSEKLAIMRSLRYRISRDWKFVTSKEKIALDCCFTECSTRLPPWPNWGFRMDLWDRVDHSNQAPLKYKANYR